MHSSTDAFGHEEELMEFFKLAMYVVHVMRRAELLTDSSNFDLCDQGAEYDDQRHHEFRRTTKKPTIEN
jgi:hypothetical protein